MANDDLVTVPDSAAVQNGPVSVPGPCQTTTSTLGIIYFLHTTFYTDTFYTGECVNFPRGVSFYTGSEKTRVLKVECISGVKVGNLHGEFQSKEMS